MGWFWDSNVVGKSDEDGVAGVYGGNDVDGHGVVGETNGEGYGVFGQSAKGDGVVGRAWAFGQVGVWGFYSDNPEKIPPNRASSSFNLPATAGVWGVTANVEDLPSGTGPVAEAGLKTASGVVGQVSLPGQGYGYGVLGLGYRDEGVVGWSEHGTGARFIGKNGPGIIATSTHKSGGKLEGATGAECTGKSGPGILATSTNRTGGKFSGVTGIECTARTDERGVTGPGIVAKAVDRPAGEFESAKRGQVRLVPRGVEFGTDAQGNSYPKLPKSGRSGEMIAVTDEGNIPVLGDECSLWLCVRSSRPGLGLLPPSDALWARVQLGSSISGEV